MYRSREEIERMLVSPETPLREAVRRLDEEGFGVVLVVEEGGRLAGILTNGDFRRFVLAGGSLSRPVAAAMNPGPLTVAAADAHRLGESVEAALSREGIRYVPVVDSSGTLVDVALSGDVKGRGSSAPSRRLPEGCPVVIMAGGRGTRLDPFTRILPKPLIPVGEKPIVEIILDRFLSHGVRHFWLSINHKGRMIRAYFEDSRADYRISFLEEDRPLGTAGALRQLAGKLEMPLFVTNCDIVVLADLTSIYEFHAEGGHDLTVVGSAQQHAIPYGVCELDGNGTLRRIVEKPRYDVVVNTGMYVLSPAVLDRLPESRRVDMTELIQDLIAAGRRVGVYPVPESAWLDVGQWEEFRKTVEQLGGSDD